MLTLLAMIILLGFGVYLIRLLPIDETFKRVAIALVIFIAIVMVLQAIGVLGPLDSIRIR